MSVTQTPRFGTIPTQFGEMPLRQKNTKQPQPSFSGFGYKAARNTYNVAQKAIDVFHKAATTGEIPTLRDYIQRGGYVDVRDDGLGGETALHRAVRANQEKAAKFLLQEGADPEMKTYGTNQTPRDLAKACTEVSKMLNNQKFLDSVSASNVHREKRKAVDIAYKEGFNHEIKNDRNYDAGSLHRGYKGY